MREVTFMPLADQAEEVAATIRRLMVMLIVDHGFDPKAVLAGLHAEAAAALVVALGRDRGGRADAVGGGACRTPAIARCCIAGGAGTGWDGPTSGPSRRIPMRVGEARRFGLFNEIHGLELCGSCRNCRG